jgi:predicted ATPase/transcriptional regulator with XRE-family HTH domain/Tfp pilus assembly protein PilF
MDVETSFGRWLRVRRRALDLTQDDLARRVGCSVVTIRKIEADERRPSRQIAERLADGLLIAADDRAAIITLARAEPYLDPAAAAPRPLPAPQRPPTNLPAPLTRLIGRKQDIAAMRNALLRGATRLVTLIGPPGIGKTRLSIEVARDVHDAFVDGASFVALAPISDPSLVIPTIAQTLGVRESAGRPLLETLKAALHSKRLLLLLDNFEHLLDAAPLIVELLEACMGLKALITSRAALHVRGEQLYPVPPLLLPDLTQLPATGALARTPAVALFVERAREVLPHFTLTAQNAAAVAAICVRLDGLPLAIELAAARIRLLSPQTLLARLEQRLDVLTDAARDLPPRHRTLRAAIAWSYDLLDASEQVLFRRLSVFVGGCTLAVAEAVCNADGDLPTDITDGVEALVDKSLLQQIKGPDDEPRFVMLETVRQYAAEKLDEAGETDMFRARHRDWFLQVAEQAYPQLDTPTVAMWFDRLAQEHDNLRAALDWSLRQGEAVKALRLTYLLVSFWNIRGHWSEGRTWIERALAVANFDSEAAVPREIALWAQALGGLGQLAFAQGDFDAASTLLEKSTGLYRDLALSRPLGADEKRGMAHARNYLGFAAFHQGDYAQATALFEETLSLWQELGYALMAGFALSLLGRVAIRQGQYERAAQLGEESVAIGRKLGHIHLMASALDATGRAFCCQGDFERARLLLEESLALSQALDFQQDVADTLNTLGLVAYYQGDYRRATDLLEEGLAVSQALQHRAGTANALSTRSEVALAQGNLARARALLVESLASFRQAGMQWNVIRGLEIMAAIDATERQSARAARLFGAASALREALGAPLPPPDRPTYDCAVESARGQLGKQAFAAAWAEARAMTLEQVIEYALNATGST